ncbi:HAD family hydrolase [Mycolicibacterium sphagni]|uniref:HAD family hydrolase n=1 Tax=Mycolicibacterium sphagni TaxID=1786 RepID=UPI001A9CAB9E|nr:HAD family hydrolase [Mycolicibacterium sphagni]
MATTTLDTISRSRSFWWDRARCAHADAPMLEAVIFDFDAPLSATERDAHMFRDLIWSLHCGDIRVAITAAGSRERIEPLVRDLIGDGVVEVMITGDDIVRPKPDPEIYRRALHELGVGPAAAMAVEHSAAGFHTARSAGLATIVVTTLGIRNLDFIGAAAMLDRYDCAEPLSAGRCRRIHEQWWINRSRLSA